MKIVLISLAFIAVAVAAPLEGDVVPIVRSSQAFETDGSYKYSFETADGVIREETGTIVNPGKEDAYIARNGLYKYTSPEGEVVEINYTADIKGYIPSGRSLPVSVRSEFPELSQS